ncbi:S8 family serine peptidase [bacterium]|nr:S8 family serine peptidase [bacterium]
MKLLWIIAIPTLIMVFTENCSKMQSVPEGNSQLYSSSENICSDTYKPTIRLQSKNQLAQNFISPFAQKKVLLDSLSQNKAAQNLNGQNIFVIVDTFCNPQANSLSALILATQKNLNKEIQNQALEFLMLDNWSLSQLEESAESDPCILAITPPSQMEQASLSLPATNDTHLSKLQHLAFTNFKHAYDYLIKKQNTAFADVAVIDSGVDCNHSDLIGNLVAGCGMNMISTTSLPMDEPFGHGTHVAGLIGAVNNNSVGTAGIAGNQVRIHAFKVLSATATSATYTFNAIQQAILQNVDVINLSLVGNNPQIRIPVLEQAVADAVASGIVVVMAAGNHSLYLGREALVSPAMVGSTLNGAIAVGSLDASNGQLSSFSNFGDNVEIATTGAVDSTSANGGIYSLAPNSSYQRMLGTSQAAPIVSGAAALVIQFLKQNNINHTPADVEQILLASTDKVPILVQGGRSLNFSKLVRNTYDFAGIPICP